MVELRLEEHNGAKFYHHYGKRKYNGLTTFGEKKAVINGILDITLMLDSYKFDKELQLTILAPKTDLFKLEIRNDSAWNKTEININIDEIDALIEALQHFKVLLDKQKVLDQWQKCQ